MRIESRSFGRPVLNHWAISPDPPTVLSVPESNSACQDDFLFYGGASSEILASLPKLVSFTHQIELMFICAAQRCLRSRVHKTGFLKETLSVTLFSGIGAPQWWWFSMYGITLPEAKPPALLLSCGLCAKPYEMVFICKDVGTSEWSNPYRLIHVRYWEVT